MFVARRAALSAAGVQSHEHAADDDVSDDGTAGLPADDTAASRA